MARDVLLKQAVIEDVAQRGLTMSWLSYTMSDMAADAKDRVIARLDAEEQALLKRLRVRTGKNTSAVIKAALRAYAESLPGGTPLEILARHAALGRVEGPEDLSATYKQHVDYHDKHGLDE